MWIRGLLGSIATISSSNFRAVPLADARRLTDGIRLTPPIDVQKGNPLLAKHGDVILPYVGFGTYKLGKQRSEEATLQALQHGYHSIDTAFIYSGETTEAAVGRALQTIDKRDSVVVTTKHWRAYHGYEATNKCLGLSLKRLGLDYVDLYLMHWPGPAYGVKRRRDDDTDTDESDTANNDPWQRAKQTPEEMAVLRAETWRAMEDALRAGLVRAIGVSNMTVRQLERLKTSATLWPPAVNQVEFHPLQPQTELLEYCQREGILVQAYASLGGQDTGKAVWNRLLAEPPCSSGKKKKKIAKTDLLHSPLVTDLAKKVQATPAQVLLRWGLERGAVVIPKTTQAERLEENAGVLNVRLSSAQVDRLEADIWKRVEENLNGEAEESVAELTRLCWRSDPLRLLDFE